MAFLQQPYDLDALIMDSSNTTDQPTEVDRQLHNNNIHPNKELTFSLEGKDITTTPMPTTPPLTDTSWSSSAGVLSPTRDNVSLLTSSLGISSSTVGSLRSTGTRDSIKAASLRENLMRCQQNRDPMMIYSLVDILGEGSMGSVCKVQKRMYAVGGSARPSFVKRNKVQSKTGNCCLPFLSALHQIMTRRENIIRLVGEQEEEELDAQSLQQQQRRSTLQSRVSSIISYGSPSSRRKEHFYALKSIHLDKCASTTLQKELINEVAILRELDHAHVAKAMETFEFHERLFIVLELCSGGDLYSRDPYTEWQAGEIITSVLSAVSYLHSRGFLHRDLKFENVMFTSLAAPMSEIKLIDFGLSQKFVGDQHLTDPVGTVYTMAPELLKGQYNSKADVWSVGVIAFMLLSSSMPFFGQTRYAVMKKICKGKVKFSAKKWAKVSNHDKGLVRHLLESEPTERPSADRALKYTKAWMRNIQQEQERKEPDSSSTDTSSTPSNNRQSQWQHNNTYSFEENDVQMMDRIQASIQAFAQYNTLKKLALMVIAYKSTASEIGWLRSTFQSRFDRLQNGELSLEEFTEALTEVYDYTPEEMEALFCGMDVDGTGTVHYTEFLAATIEAHGSIEEDRIADAFDRIDCDDSGYITIQNLRDFLGDDVPHSYLESIIDDADLVEDKRICYDEFLELWDSTYETLCEARKEVAVRRMKRNESLLTFTSDGGTTGSETDDDEERQDKLPELEAARVDQLGNPSTTIMTPVIHNTRTRDHCGPVECFSQRKALSLRAGWV